MLTISNLHVYYGAIRALGGVSLEVNQGEIVTMIGANGAGKSTTIRAVSGFVRPSQGEIIFPWSIVSFLPGILKNEMIKNNSANVAMNMIQLKMGT